MLKRLLRKIVVSSLVKMICAALKPVPVLGVAAQVIAFAM